MPWKSLFGMTRKKPYMLSTDTIFFPSVSDSQLVEFMNTEPAGMEGRLYFNISTTGLATAVHPG
jgi:hypothetical protein